MKPKRFLILLPLLPLLLAGCALFDNGKPQTLTLVYSGNLDGELEPCGCSESGNLGGIKRRANVVDKLRQENSNLFLVSAGGLLISEMPQDRLKSEYILKGLAALNYDAIGVQWKDLAFGAPFLQDRQLPFTASNWHDTAFAKQRLAQRGHQKLAFFQWLDPAGDPQGQMQGGKSTLATSDVDGLAEAIIKAKAQGATTVLSTTLPLVQARKLVPLDNVDVLLIKAKLEEYGEPQKIGRTFVLQPGSRGMRLGRADFTVDAKGNLSELKHQVIPLPKEVGEASRMTAWYAEYNAKVKADYEQRVALRKSQQSGQSPYAGDETCGTCHTKEHEIWSDSRHAEAFYALQDAGKAFDPECISCHTVGFEKPGGFIDPALTPNLMQVQCESCHGPGKAHADSGGKTPVANAGWSKEQICGQCHVHAHSPDFDINTYWPKIAHGEKAK